MTTRLSGPFTSRLKEQLLTRPALITASGGTAPKTEFRSGQGDKMEEEEASSLCPSSSLDPSSSLRQQPGETFSTLSCIVFSLPPPSRSYLPPTGDRRRGRSHHDGAPRGQGDVIREEAYHDFITPCDENGRGGGGGRRWSQPTTPGQRGGHAATQPKWDSPFFIEDHGHITEGCTT